MRETFSLVKYGGPHLWTRELAKKVRADLTAMLETLGEGQTLIVDCKGVEVFDYSFANELFGKTLLTLSHEYPGRFVVIENLTGYTRENLAKALESLSLVAVERKGGKLQLIGKVHPADRETFEVIAKAKGAITASALKEQLGVNLTAINERLTKLTGLAVIRRERGTSPAGREQYLYSAPA